MSPNQSGLLMEIKMQISKTSLQQRKGGFCEYKNGKEHYDEILCAMKGLPTALAEATITLFTLKRHHMQEQQQVQLSLFITNLLMFTNGATLTVTASGQTNPTATATYNSGSGTNRLVFTFTVPNAATNLSIIVNRLSHFLVLLKMLVQILV